MDRERASTATPLTLLPTLLALRDRMQGEHGYAVFGTVVEGLDVVDAISGLAIENRGPMQGVPVESVTMDSIRRLP